MVVMEGSEGGANPLLHSSDIKGVTVLRPMAVSEFAVDSMVAQPRVPFFILKGPILSRPSGHILRRVIHRGEAFAVRIDLGDQIGIAVRANTNRKGHADPGSGKVGVFFHEGGSDAVFHGELLS